MICARARCEDPAAWQVVWRNPKIHDESRRKVWPACGEHVAVLRDYLGSRGFPVAVIGSDDDATGVVFAMDAAHTAPAAGAAS